MEMGTTLIGAICIVACFLPFILMSQSKKKREKQKLQSLVQIANLNECVLSQHEFCGDFVIGIDELKKTVFFHKKTNEKVSEQSVDLAKVKECNLINLRSSANQNSIDKLALKFTFKGASDVSQVFEFYNSNERLNLFNELQVIKKWFEIIDRSMRNK